MTRLSDLASQVQVADAEARRARRKFERELRRQRIRGRTVRDLAQETGLSYARIHQLTRR